MVVINPKLDGKFGGIIYKVKNGLVVPEDQWCCFLAKDNAFANILPRYLDECRNLGADQDQLNAVGRMIMRVASWRARNSAQCKVPDAKGDMLSG